MSAKAFDVTLFIDMTTAARQPSLANTPPHTSGVDDRAGV